MKNIENSKRKAVQLRFDIIAIEHDIFLFSKIISKYKVFQYNLLCSKIGRTDISYKDKILTKHSTELPIISVYLLTLAIFMLLL